MNKRIINLIANIAKCDPALLEQSPTETGLWDSFTHVDIVLTLEEEFTVTFTHEEIAEMTTLAKISEMVALKSQAE